MKVQIAEKLLFLITERKRYKGAYGGRGASKSWGFTDAILCLIMQQPDTPLRILCARELQNSIKDSVHRLISDRIAYHKLDWFFNITENEIRGANGTLFIFRGLRNNYTEIKSLEGIDLCWIEEAEKISQESLDVLIPTIRKPGSELWFSWNTGTTNDPVWKLLITSPRHDSIVVKVNYYDNPWFPEVLRKEMEHDKKYDPAKHKRIWLGEPSEGGLFFSNFDKEASGEEPYIIPAHVGERSIFGGFDFGWGQKGYASFGMWHLDSAGVPHRLLTWYRNGLTAQEQADDLFDYIASFFYTSGVFPVEIWYDNQMDNKGNLEATDAAPIDYFKKRWLKGNRGTKWTPANKNRVNGWQVVIDYLGRDVDTKEPKLKYWRQFNKVWVDCLLQLPADENNPLDAEKCDIDHSADETRYCLVGLRNRMSDKVISDKTADYNALMRQMRGMAVAETGLR